MKRKRIILVIIVLVVVGGSVMAILFFNKELNNNTGAKVILTATLREEGVVELEIYNNGDKKINFGLGYELQVYEEGEWKSYPEERAFDALELFRYPGESYVESVWLNEELVNQKAKVRVVKEIEGVKYYSNAFKVK